MTKQQTSVPASVAGYLVQVRRALFRLADASIDAEVGVETLDDVATITPTSIESEQDKLSLSADNSPVSDRSVDLWKTLDIWTSALPGFVGAGIEARFFLSTNRPCTGVAVSMLTAVDRNESANQKIVDLLAAEATSKTSDSPLQTLINKVVGRGTSVLLNVVRNTTIQSGPGVFDQTIVDSTISKLHIPDTINTPLVYEALVGWALAALLDRWKAGQPGWISRRSFDRQLSNIQRGLIRAALTARAARVVHVTEDDKAEARTHRFLYHLLLIDMDANGIDDELANYIRFNKEKLRLVDEGNVLPDEIEARGDRLCAIWSTVFKRCCLGREEKEPSEILGMKIFLELATHREPLGGDPVQEPYMTVGHFHRLADEDRVYWYPDYKKE